MCKGSLQLILLVWLVCRIIGERTLARGVLIDFSHISRGVFPSPEHSGREFPESADQISRCVLVFLANLKFFQNFGNFVPVCNHCRVD